MRFILPLILFSVFGFSCDRPRVDPNFSQSRLTLRIPEQAQTFSSRQIGPQFFANNWGVADPVNDSDLICYAVMVGGPKLDDKICRTISGAEVFRVGVIAGSISSGQTLTVEVPQGLKREIRLIGFAATAASDCSDVTKLTPTTKSKLSAPFMVASTVMDLSKSEETITLTSKVTGATKFFGCDSGFGEVDPGPTIGQISPTTGVMAGGTTLTITGNHFTANDSVQIGTTACAVNAGLSNATTLVCVTGAASAGVYDVTVTNTAGQVGKKSSAYTYVAANPVTVTALFPNNGENWNDYVVNNAASIYLNADVACPAVGNDLRSCVNGGLFRKAAILDEASCTGLTAEDKLGALNWVCYQNLGVPTFYSTGFKTGYGLRDLLQSGPSFKTNVLRIYKNNQLLYQSAAQNWWGSTPVQALPASSGSNSTALTATGTIYVANTSIQVTGYAINADKISLVTLPGVVLTAGSTGGGSSCNENTAEPPSGSKKCLIAAGSQKYLWIEAIGNQLGGAEADFGLLFYNVKFSVVHNSSFVNAASLGYNLALRYSNNNIIEGILSQNSNVGLWFDSSSFNVARDIRVFNHATYGFQVSNGSSENKFVGLLASGNDYGLGIFGSSTKNTISHITATNTGAYGIQVADATLTTVTQALLTNSNAGIKFDTSANVGKLSTLAVVNNDAGIQMYNSSQSVFSGKLYVTSTTSGCQISGGGTHGFVNSTCAAANGSSISLGTGKNSTFSFVGKLTQQEHSNTTNTMGSTTYTPGLDFLNFSINGRGWGTSGSSYPNFDQRSRCTGGICQIWDWRYDITDAVLRVANGVVNDTTLCPPSVAGGDADVAMTDNAALANVFLVNAVELNYDGVGDDDGLCESNEACVFSSGFGALQGSGDERAKSCVFANGTITNVKMYGYADTPTFANIGTIVSANGGQQLVKAAGSISNARTSISQTSGKYYFEVKLIGANFSDVRIGVGQAGAPTSGALGMNADSWVLDLSGAAPLFYHNGSSSTLQTSGYPAFTSGDTLAVALDLDAGKIYFADRNGDWGGGIQPGQPGAVAAASSINSAQVYVMVGLNNPMTAEVNLGQKNFKFSVPAGFKHGWF